MKIEKVSDNRIKIMFDSDELEENNISVHSFLANSEDTKKLFIAILDIANEEFGFNAKDCKINYETISFDNKKFMIIITKALCNTKINSNNSPYNLLEIYNTQTSNNFEDETTSNYYKYSNKDILFYKFSSIEELFNFCTFLTSSYLKINFKNSLYQYHNNYFLKVNLQELDNIERTTITSIMCEYTDSIYLSNLAISKFNETCNLLIENNAIQSLKQS